MGDWPVVMERDPARDLPYAEATLERSGELVGIFAGGAVTVVRASGQVVQRVETGEIVAWAIGHDGTVAFSHGRDLVVVAPSGQRRVEDFEIYGPRSAGRPKWADEAGGLWYSDDDTFVKDLVFAPGTSDLVVATEHELLRMDGRTLGVLWRVDPEYGANNVGFVGGVLWSSDPFANHLWDPVTGAERQKFGGGFVDHMGRDAQGRLWTCASVDMPAVWDEATWTSSRPFGNRDNNYFCDFDGDRALFGSTLWDLREGRTFPLGHSDQHVGAVFVGEELWVPEPKAIRRYRASGALESGPVIEAGPDDLRGAFWGLGVWDGAVVGLDGDRGLVRGPFGARELGLVDPWFSGWAFDDQAAWMVDADGHLARVGRDGRVSVRPFADVVHAERLPDGRWVGIGEDNRLGLVKGRKVVGISPPGSPMSVSALRSGRVAWADELGLHVAVPGKWKAELLVATTIHVSSVVEGADGSLLVSGRTYDQVDAYGASTPVADLLAPDGTLKKRIWRDFDGAAAFVTGGGFVVADQDLRWFSPDGVEVAAWRVASGYGFDGVFEMPDGAVYATQRWEDGHRWWRVNR